MENLEKFKEKQVNVFLELLEKYDGATPIFTIQYRKNSDRTQGIYLSNSSSGFIRIIQKNGGMTHLKNGYLSVDFY